MRLPPSPLMLVLVPSAACAFAAAATTLMGCFGVSEPPRVVTVPVGSATAMPLVMITAPPQRVEQGELVTSRAQLPSADEEAIGSAAPGFVLKSATRGPDAELRYGKVTIVHFWATWCAPCKQSLPHLEAIYSRYRARGVEVIALSVDDENGNGQIAEFMKTFQVQVKYPVAWDPDHKIAELYRPPSMPSTYVIDRQGVVRFVHRGYHDGEADEVEEEIKGLL